MEHRLLLVLAALTALISCGPRPPAATDFPHYAFRTSTTLELMRVERTDTATLFRMRAYYIPGWWFQIDSLTCLRAGERRFRLHGASGIVPGRREYIGEEQQPGEGFRDFVLYFDPLPRDVERCDFIEGDSAAGFHFYGIDLTGRPVRLVEEPAGEGYPERLPEGCTEPGFTTLRVHIPLSVSDPFLNGTVLAEPRRTGQLEMTSFRFDRDGVGTVRFRQRQTSRVQVILGSHAAAVSLWTRPGETADIYWIPDNRSLTVSRFGLLEEPVPALRFEGAYAAVNTRYGRIPRYRLDLDDPAFVRGIRSGAGYADLIRAQYEGQRASLESDTGLTPLQRDLAEVLLKGDVVKAVCTAGEILRLSYTLEHGTDAGFLPPAFAEDDFAWLAALDLSDSRMLFSEAAEYLSCPAVRKYTSRTSHAYKTETLYPAL